MGEELSETSKLQPAGVQPAERNASKEAIQIAWQRSKDTAKMETMSPNPLLPTLSRRDFLAASASLSSAAAVEPSSLTGAEPSKPSSKMIGIQIGAVSFV